MVSPPFSTAEHTCHVSLTSVSCLLVRRILRFAFYIFFTLYHKRRTPYEPVHICGVFLHIVTMILDHIFATVTVDTILQLTLYRIVACDLWYNLIVFDIFVSLFILLVVLTPFLVMWNCSLLGRVQISNSAHCCFCYSLGCRNGHVHVYMLFFITFLQQWP
jgi:hypothetical protein